MFIAFELAGCSLVEQVVVIEPRIERAKEAVKPSRTASRGVAIASGELKCAQGVGGPGCRGEVISKSYSARYDSGPVLKPIKKTPENKPVDAREDSAFVSAVKSWIKTGMQLPGWAGPK
jgi:hypothetical protein